MGYPTQRLDFDEWRRLASTDPEAFEVMRREVLQAVIDQAPERRRPRLRGLQWRVDLVRQRSSSPMAACISLSDMMWEAFAGDKGLVDTLRGYRRPAPPDPEKREAGAVAAVIPLTKARKSHL